MMIVWPDWAETVVLARRWLMMGTVADRLISTVDEERLATVTPLAGSNRKEASSERRLGFPAKSRAKPAKAVTVARTPAVGEGEKTAVYCAPEPVMFVTEPPPIQ